MANEFHQSPNRAFNLPTSIVVLAGILIGIHVLRSYLISEEFNITLLLLFAFIPSRYGLNELDPLSALELPGGVGADIWTFLTYAFFHANSAHLIFNLLWMAIFGSAIAWRFGPLRFLLFTAVCAISGALMHLITNFGEFAVTIGASAAISGQMAGAMRFIFVAGGPLGVFRQSDYNAYLVPSVSIQEAFSDRQILTFLAIWFVLNLIVGLTGETLLSGEGNVAWQAHIGGFAAGLFLFGLFDPIGKFPTIRD